MAWFVDTRADIYVAKHPNTSIDSLLILAANSDHWVRDEIIQRPDLIEIVLEKLTETTLVQAQAWTDTTEGKYLDSLYKIAMHPQTPTHILEMMATTKPVTLHQGLSDFLLFHLCRCVANNVNTPISILEELAEHENPVIRNPAKKMLKAKYQLPFHS